MAYSIGHGSGCHLNPARSTGPAIIEGGIALFQLWIFWVAPIASAAIAGVVCRFVAGSETSTTSD